MSHKKAGDPAYVREYKGMDPDGNITTNCLFEIEIQDNSYAKNAQHEGANLVWRKQQKSSLTNQQVRFRHLNSGKLLSVIEIPKKPQDSAGQGGQSNKSQRVETRQILGLGANIDKYKINERLARINEIIAENKKNINFNPNTDETIKQIKRSVEPHQVFQIENTIIDPEVRIKNGSVVKIKNMMYNQYVSTHYKRADGEADEGEGEDDEEDEAPSQSAAASKRTTEKRSESHGGREIDHLVDEEPNGSQAE
jgi:hypothetical protein